MSYLLDTNVVSELRKRPGRVHEGVLQWASLRTPGELHLSAVSLLEIELGILRVERRDRLQGQRLRRWLSDGVLAGFTGRILAVDAEVALRAARLHVPDPRPERDAYVEATAIVHGLTVVTRNEADFRSSEVRVVNPWRQLD